MFAQKVNKKLKLLIQRELRTDPDGTFIQLRNLLYKNIVIENKKEINSIIIVFKDIIKDNLPAKVKFYVLLLLKELMESRNKNLIECFQKNLMDRLATIANFGKNPQQCLDIYYQNDSQENKKYSEMFYILLIECWRRWDIYYSSDQKKFKKKAEKLRKKFKSDELFYTMFMDQSPRSYQRGNYQNRQYQSNYYNRGQSIPPKSIYQQNQSIFRSKDDIQNINIQTSANELKQDQFQYSEKMLKANMKNANDAKQVLFDIISNNNSIQDFPKDIFENFYLTFKEQNNFFLKYQNLVEKDWSFSKDFKSKFYKDSLSTENFYKIFDDFHNKRISYQDFFLKLKAQEKLQNIQTLISLEEQNHYQIKNKNQQQIGLENNIEMIERKEEIDDSKAMTFGEQNRSSDGFKSQQTNNFKGFDDFIQQEQDTQIQKSELLESKDEQNLKKSFQNYFNEENQQQPKIENLPNKQIQQRQKKFENIQKQNMMTVIEEESNELFDSKISKMSKKLALSSLSQNKPRNSQNDEQNFENEFRRSSRDKKTPLKQIPEQSEDNNLQNFQFESPLLQPQKKKSSFYTNNDQNSPQIQQRDSFKKSSKFKKQKSKKLPIKIDTQNPNIIQKQDSFKNLSLKQSQDPFKNSLSFPKFEEKKETVEDLFLEFNDIQETISRQSQSLKSTKNIQNNSFDEVDNQNTDFQFDFKKQQQKSSIDNIKFNEPEFQSPNFENSQNKTTMNDQSVPIFKKKESNKNISQSSMSEDTHPQIIKVKKSLNRKSIKLSPLTDDNKKRRNTIQQPKQIDNQEKASLQEQCEILFKKLCEAQNELEKLKTNQNKNQFFRNNEEIARYFQEQIKERKNKYLEDENKLLKIQNEQLKKDSNQSIEVKQNENILLKSLVSEFQKYSQSLKQKLIQEKQSKNEYEEQIKKMKQMMKQYESKLHQKKSQKIDFSLDLEKQFDDDFEQKTEKNDQNAFQFVPQRELFQLFQDNFMNNSGKNTIQSPQQTLQNSFFKQLQQKNLEQQENFSQIKKNSFINQNNPYFQDKQNLLQLKASSLFENGILLDNDLIQIYCSTQNRIYKTERIVSLILMFSPKVRQLKISTILQQNSYVQSNPIQISNQIIDEPIYQEFSLRIFCEFKQIQMPTLHIKIQNQQQIQQHDIPLPFTINKFIEFQPYDQQQMSYILNNIPGIFNEIINEKIYLDQDILTHWNQLKEEFQQ